MILILEIIFTIIAWRKGWKGWALLPLGICMFVGILIGLSVGASEGSIEDVAPWCILLDLVALISLIVLMIRAPRSIEQTQIHKIEKPTAQTAA